MKRLLFALAFFSALPAFAQTAKATFAGGCFWCVEADLSKMRGVTEVVSGYTGGSVKNPSYEQVSAGGTGHREAVQVTLDMRGISYKVIYGELLDAFWHDIDPFDSEGQFCDKGPQYTSAIYYHDAQQKAWAEASKAALEQRFKHKIVTEILPAGPFYVAEEYHQDYAKKNPVRYHFYRFNCGRDQRLQQIWGRVPR